MKRRGIAAIITFLTVLGATGGASAAPAAAQAVRVAGAQGISQPDKVVNHGLICPYPDIGVTWQSSEISSYVLSNDGWSSSNGKPILSWKWLDQYNQCFYDWQVSNGNWIEEEAFDAGTDQAGVNGQCMEDPAWKFNAGVDQYSCAYYYQLNEQWAEQNFSCGAGESFVYALQNQGVNQDIYFNAQNSQVLLRNVDESNLRECWW
jgi:hypothetical protein